MEIKKNENDYTVTLTEAELDALRHPMGRITGDVIHPVREVCTAFYFAAQSALGYLDDTRAMTGYLGVDHLPTPTSDRPRRD